MSTGNLANAPDLGHIPVVEGSNSSYSQDSKSLNFDPAFEVHLEEHEDPQMLPEWRKWLAISVISISSFCVTSLSSVAAMTEVPVAREFHVSKLVATLGVSLFVEGLGVGPLLVGPLSEVYGRNMVYRISFALIFALSFGITFAPNLASFLVCRLLTGLCGSAFLSVSGGSVSDMFDNAHVAMPMTLFTVSCFSGPVIGPLIGGFVTQNLYWRWTYRIFHIWILGQLIALLLCVPETYAPLLLKLKARRLRASEERPYWSPLDKKEGTLVDALIFSCKTPFQLLLFDRMVLLLNVWNALILGILYLAFQAFPIIFQQGHGFNVQTTGLTFLGIGLGMIISIGFQPFIIRRTRRIAQENDGRPPPETHLFGGQIGGTLVALSLFFLAFTTYPHVHWIVPIIASVPFGLGTCLTFISTFTYLVTAYRPISASAMASNSALRSTFAGVFPLFAGAMYERLGTVGATALLAGLATIMAPFPFIFARIGGRLREKSPYAAK